MTIPDILSGKVGFNLILTCKVAVTKYLIVTPRVEWINNGSIVAGGNGVIVDETSHNGVIYVKTLTFTPLFTSHQANYTCKADINITSISLKRTKNETISVMVQSK